MQPQDRVVLPSGRTGTLLEPPGGKTMPKHGLVLLDETRAGYSDRLWVLADLIHPIADAAT